jgi:hypothetical protein
MEIEQGPRQRPKLPLPWRIVIGVLLIATAGLCLVLGIRLMTDLERTAPWSWASSLLPAVGLLFVGLADITLAVFAVTGARPATRWPLLFLRLAVLVFTATALISNRISGSPWPPWPPWPPESNLEQLSAKVGIAISCLALVSAVLGAVASISRALPFPAPIVRPPNRIVRPRRMSTDA